MDREDLLEAKDQLLAEIEAANAGEPNALNLVDLSTLDRQDRDEILEAVDVMNRNALTTFLAAEGIAHEEEDDLVALVKTALGGGR